MSFDFILGMVLFSYLRKFLRTTGLTSFWDKVLQYGLIISIVLMVINIVQPGGRHVTEWIMHLILVAFIYITLKLPIFKPARSIIYAVLPLVIIAIIEDVLQLLNNNQYDDWLDSAEIFAIVWWAAMWFIINRQKKALEKEQQKAKEKEAEIKITEALKAELEVQVAERTAQLTAQKEELQLAITELKATQAQLIQSEKMASLGELTAGIAHEIQNPLNFVNNFSEVNAELVEEMKTALAAGDKEEAIAIANDIAANEQKINHHGKRADAIVKGMLQHSRTSSAIKEPADINALADEYFRLAYHGLRAKDKTFNATLKSNFDDTIGSINIIPQDIGRVVLNLFTNAFYAVTERKKQNIPGYEPTVTLSTKKQGNKVVVMVQDNGNGIPQKVVDKIFQPFFTTKPTGQGTGLGLSLSYDIVKAHNGELKVTTTEGTGTVFIIELPV